MGKATVPPQGGNDDNIEPVDLKAALEERYLAYALWPDLRPLPPEYQE